MKANLKLACLLITASAGLIVFSFVSMEFVFKLACLLITAPVGASAVIIGASVSEYIHSNKSKKRKEDEVIITEKAILHDLSIDKIVIDVDGKDVFLSASAEELLRRLLTKREKSSLLYA